MQSYRSTASFQQSASRRLRGSCRLVFHGTSKLLTKLSKLLQVGSPNCKIPKESECEPALATADVVNPCKKHKIKEEAASAVIPVCA